MLVVASETKPTQALTPAKKKKASSSFKKKTVFL
jgi:hypothetical protein